MPPRAATGSPARPARPAQRQAPSAGSPGWLAVAKAGDKKAMVAPLRRARRRSARECAELVTIPPSRNGPGQRPPRKCTPAPNAAASRTSPATTSASPRIRQIRARSRPIATRLGCESCRNTTPEIPRGNRAAAGRGSGNRAVSVNSHSTGGAVVPSRRAAARPHARSFISTGRSGGRSGCHLGCRSKYPSPPRSMHPSWSGLTRPTRANGTPTTNRTISTRPKSPKVVGSSPTMTMKQFSFCPSDPNTHRHPVPNRRRWSGQARP